MGTIYYAVCKKCKVIRDLDKFYCAGFKEENTRDSALDFANKHVRESPFRFGLLADFMHEHMGHDCVFTNEHAIDEFDDYQEDVDYWVLSEKEIRRIRQRRVANASKTTKA